MCIFDTWYCQENIGLAFILIQNTLDVFSMYLLLHWTTILFKNKVNNFIYLMVNVGIVISWINLSRPYHIYYLILYNCFCRSTYNFLLKYFLYLCICEIFFRCEKALKSLNSYVTISTIGDVHLLKRPPNPSIILLENILNMLIYIYLKQHHTQFKRNHPHDIPTSIFVLHWNMIGIN